jgi:uncharacterized protein YbjQ (UPF0145 family)
VSVNGTGYPHADGTAIAAGCNTMISVWDRADGLAFIPIAVTEQERAIIVSFHFIARLTGEGTTTLDSGAVGVVDARTVARQTGGMAFRPARTLTLNCDICSEEFPVPQGYSGGLTCPACLADPLAARITRMILTTADSIEGQKVATTLEIVAVEHVIGLTFWQQLFTDFEKGGRSKTISKALRDMRRACLQGLREEAAELGADAVIGVRLSYSEIGAESKEMFMMIASGTAVRLESTG